MATNRDDDYLICKHYYNHINDISTDHKDFITFTHKDNYYFAWVNDGKVILRSEAYPSAEKVERGIKAILKNWNIHERYSIDSQHGVHFLQLWGGGNHQKHSGNLNKHNEIGRSCPFKTKDELYAMMGFKGKDFVNGVFGLSSGSQSSSYGKGASIAAATAGAASLAASGGGSKKSKGGSSKVAATSSKATASTGKSSAAYASTGSSTTKAAATSSSGFKWWWLLPLLLIPAFFLFKGCGGDAVSNAAAKTEMSAKAIADKAADKAAAALAATKKASADAAAKLKIENAAADKLAADKAAAAKKVKATGGSGNRSNSSSGGASYRGNKNSGF